MAELVFGAGLFLVGYIIGRGRFGPALLSWATHTETTRKWFDPRRVAAVTILGLRHAFIWVVHPRKTEANVRAARQNVRSRAPVYDPDWARKREE